MRSPSDTGNPRSGYYHQQVRFHWEDIKCPGLTAGAVKINRIVEQLPRKWAVYSYKKSAEALWVVFVGGTGTGKSTIFNALCENPVSQTGFERPKTFGPIAYAHKNLPIDLHFPFLSMTVKSQLFSSVSMCPYAGEPGILQIVQHSRQDLDHLILVDTPDLDSLETRNREIVEDLYLLSDVIVFVTSQEKYADEVPFQFLKRVYRDGKICFLLLNKGQDLLSADEVAYSFKEQGIKVEESRFWVLPYLPASPAEKLRESDSFNGFLSTFFDSLSKSRIPSLIQDEEDRRIQGLSKEIQLLVDLLRKEQQAAKSWLGHLERLHQSVCENLLELQAKHFDEESRDYLQEEIRKLFSKYDVLRKPRRFVSQILLSPLRLMGLRTEKQQKSHKEVLLGIRERINLVPIQAAVEKLNRSVLENLSPSEEESPLYQILRDPDLKMTEEEIRAKVWEEQEKLANWLDRTFQEMAQGIPKTKEWGIYSTSILWGALILSFEAAVGGGITFVEAVLDSAIAPFVTKGAVELFAYQELQKIARNLAKKYQEGLLSVLRQQLDRYKDSLQLLTVSRETLDSLVSLQGTLRRS